MEYAMNTVEVRNLSKVFTQGTYKVKAVDNVSFDIAQGELVSITGQSGSGKTTLLNLIGGIEVATHGSVFIDGIDICKADEQELARLRRQSIGYVFQDFNLIPILTVEENIIMPLLLDGKKVDRRNLVQLTRFLGLKDRLTHLPSQLSGGQKQRVAIARALINRPSIILADEPTGNLDRAMADEIMQLLLDLNKEGITILLVTHEECYADLCPRKLIISDGHLVEDR